MEDENNNKMNKTEENTLQSNEDVVMQDSESNKKKMDILDKMMDEITFSDSEDDDKKR